MIHPTESWPLFGSKAGLRRQAGIAGYFGVKVLGIGAPKQA